MRRGITSQYGLAEAELHMPSLPAIPLFRSIPIRLRIICTSKPLSTSTTGTPQFEFPRNPKPIDVDLTLRQVCNVTVRSYHRVETDDLGRQAGFGVPDGKARATWGDQIQATVQGPHWTMDRSQGNKGCWSEEVTFISAVMFRCAPPFTTPSLASSLYLALGIDFPGLGNKLKADIGPLPLASGIGPHRGSDAGTPEVSTFI